MATPTQSWCQPNAQVFVLSNSLQHKIIKQYWWRCFKRFVSKDHILRLIRIEFHFPFLKPILATSGFLVPSEISKVTYQLGKQSRTKKDDFQELFSHSASLDNAAWGFNRIVSSCRSPLLCRIPVYIQHNPRLQVFTQSTEEHYYNINATQDKALPQNTI